ncbi:MAG: hypothetical protein IPI54_12395 [Chitinophagaceae bacterium]|nr:hypothetical protein [Chitinophagaceae bacterium]
MKYAFGLYFLVLLTGRVDCFSQTPVNPPGIILPSKHISLDAGFNVSLPAHDDLMRTHTLGMGITARAMVPISKRWNIGIRAEFDHRFAKKNYPDSVLKFTNKHSNYSMMSLKPGVQFNFRPRYFAGLGAGMAYVMLQNDSKTGFGFVEEFDGSTQIGYSMEIYAGKKFNYWHGRKNLALSIYWLFFYAERHGESAVGLRSSYLFSR